MPHWLKVFMSVVLGSALMGSVFLPAGAGAQSQPLRPISDATDLMYAARGILWAEEEEVDITGGRAGLMVSTSPRPEQATSPAEQILVRLINATKEQLRDKKAACRAATRALQSEGKDCEFKLLSAACDADEARLNARLALLHKIRGDRRKALTEFWSSVKRSARSVWHRLGPKGRSFFRAFGTDVVQAAVTGGTVNRGLFRTVFLNRVRSTFSQEVQAAAQRLIARVTVGRVRASAAGGDPCAERVAATATGERPSWLSGIPIDEFAGDDTCQGDWLDDEWSEVETQLLAEHKACQAWPIEQYRQCLDQQAKQGACASDAASACADLYSAIPTDTLSVNGVKGDTGYAWPVDDMTFSYGGGSADGTIHIEDKHTIDDCIYMIDVTLSGSFDYPTCSFKGAGTYSFTARETTGAKCLLLGEDGPRIGIPITWEATLEDGEVNGMIHRDAGNAFSFKVPVGEGE